MEGNFVTTFYKAPSKNFVQLNLDGSINSSQDTITLNDASDLNFPGAIVVDRLDANGTSTPASREVITYTGITGNQLTGCTRGVDGTIAQSHSDQARVDTVLTVGMYNDLVDIVSTALDSTGTNLLVSNATITGSINVSGASIVGINLNEFNNVTVTGTADFEVASFSSIASIARAEIATAEITNSVVSNATITQINPVTSKNHIVTVTDAATVTFDGDLGNIFQVTLGGNRTLAVSNIDNGQVFMVRLTQDGSGNRTVSWFAGIKWVENTVPTLTTTGGRTDVFGFIRRTDGNYDGYIVGKNMA